jgi:urease subunit alpha
MKLDRRAYADHYGPTTGDRIRLADTNLIIEIESDATTYGDEAKFGGGKVIRDGMGQSARATRAGGAPDLVITNAVIVDSSGIRKADVGIRDGRIAAIGKAGNPDVMAGVTAGLEIAASTEVLAGEGHILTCGAIDTHVHFISPNQIPDAFYSGVTTLIGGGTGPATGTKATTCTPGAWNIRRMYESVQAFPLNFGFLGKGNASGAEVLREQIRAGALGLKLHEDWGTTPSAIDRCLEVADEFDVQVAIHTDTLNEDRFRRRHDCGDPRKDDSHLPHRRRRRRPRPRHHPAVRRGQRAALVDKPDDAVHAKYARRAPGHADGLPSPVTGRARRHRVCRFAHPPRDDRGRGRPARSRRDQHHVVGLAGDGTHRRGDLPDVADGRQDEAAARRAVEDAAGHDNYRVRRYIAKYTINPAIAHGIAHEVGAIAVGKMADLVLWKPAFFGVKPEVVIKGGFIAGAMMGDGNASIPTPQPVVARPMFGAVRRCAAHMRGPFRQSCRSGQRRPRRSRAAGGGGGRLPQPDQGRSRAE